MIYLIGGSPRCGKTTLAKKLSQKLKISWVSSDSIEGMITPYIPKNKLDTLFPKSKIRRLTKRSNDLMYSKYTAKQLTDAYIKQAKTT